MPIGSASMKCCTHKQYAFLFGGTNIQPVSEALKQLDRELGERLRYWPIAAELLLYEAALDLQ